jgi:hypothetical protein
MVRGWTDAIYRDPRLKVPFIRRLPNFLPGNGSAKFTRPRRFCALRQFLPCYGSSTSTGQKARM